MDATADDRLGGGVPHRVDGAARATSFVGCVSWAAFDARLTWARPPNCDESRIHHGYQAAAETRRWRERWQLTVRSQAHGAGVTQPRWTECAEVRGGSERRQQVWRSHQQLSLQPPAPSSGRRRAPIVNGKHLHRATGGFMPPRVGGSTQSTRFRDLTLAGGSGGKRAAREAHDKIPPLSRESR